MQNPIIRRLWPRRYRRSDVYHRLIGLEHRYGVATRVDRWRGNPPRERVVQDVEIPLEATADFLRWFDANVPMSPLWLCPLQLREPAGAGSARRWPLYPLTARPAVRQRRVLGHGADQGRGARRRRQPRRRAAVTDAGGHKGLYSDAYYDRATFDELYGGTTYQAVKDALRPGAPTDRPLREGGGTTMTVTTRERRSAPAAAPQAAQAEREGRARSCGR